MLLEPQGRDFIETTDIEFFNKLFFIIIPADDLIYDFQPWFPSRSMLPFFSKDFLAAIDIVCPAKPLKILSEPRHHFGRHIAEFVMLCHADILGHITYGRYSL